MHFHLTRVGDDVRDKTRKVGVKTQQRFIETRSRTLNYHLKVLYLIGDRQAGENNNGID